MRRVALGLTAVMVIVSVFTYAVPSAFGSVDHRCKDASCSTDVGTPGSPTTGGTGTASSPIPPAGNYETSSGPCPPRQVPSYSLDTQAGQPVTAQPGDLNPITGAPVAPGSELEVVLCNGSYLTTLVIPPGANPGGAPAVTGAQLAREAFSSFAVSAPTPEFSPTTSVVGVATWLWLEGGWSSHSATASVPGLSATVTAEPTSVIWSMGDGGQTVCDGPGKPWNPNNPNATTDCSYTYPVAGHFTATVIVYYQTTWSASDGTAGQLAAITGRTTVPVTVEEIQAVNSN